METTTKTFNGQLVQQVTDSRNKNKKYTVAALVPLVSAVQEGWWRGLRACKLLRVVLARARNA